MMVFIIYGIGGSDKRGGGSTFFTHLDKLIVAAHHFVPHIYTILFLS